MFWLTIQDYVGRQLGSLSAQIEEDHAASAKLAAETASMKAEMHELQTKVRIFNSCVAART